MERREFRNYLIKKGMQIGLTFRFMLLIALFSLFLIFETYITIWPVVVEYIPKDLLGLIRHQILFRFFFFVLPIIVVIGIIVIIFSHRIAGPIYNIEQKINRLAGGEDIESIRLRKGDEFKELAVAINKFISIVKSLKSL
jgi:signal transduction histidine kinase